MSEALRLAEILERPGYGWHSTPKDVAAELRRLAPMEAELQQAREELATCRELLAEIRASLDKPIEQLETMPMREKEELVMGWFAEDWAISKGLDMINDYEKLRGMK